MKIVITAGEAFTDIDVFASAAAYSELLNLKGVENQVVLPGILNASVPKKISELFQNFKTNPTFEHFEVVIVDVSEPAFVAKFVDIENIYEIYDHRYGFEDFWREKLGEKSHIDIVGACATLIWEKYKEYGYSESISQACANLISIAIVSNTLDFKSSVTTQRDIIAFDELSKFTNLSDTWKKDYFNDVESSIFQDIKNAIAGDTKKINFGNNAVVMGQLELWNGSSIILEHAKDIEDIMNSFDDENWFLSIVSISENKNYFYTKSVYVKDILSKIIPINFKEDIGFTDKLWLRKEIRKKLLLL